MIIISININNIQKCVESVPINTNLIPSPYRCAFSRLFHDPAIFPMTECDSFFIFSNFARQWFRLHKISWSKKRSHRVMRNDEWRDITGNLIWFLFTARRSSRLHRIFDVGYRDDRSKFRLRRFHVRIDTMLGWSSWLKMIPLWLSHSLKQTDHYQRLLISSYYRCMYIYA